MKFGINIERLIKKLRIKSDADMQGRILGDALSVLERRACDNVEKRRSDVFAITIRIRAKYAFAAGIILAMLSGIYYFSVSVDGSSVAWADVARKVEQVETFTYRMRTNPIGGPQDGSDRSETILYFSPKYGVRLGTYIDGRLKTREFILPEENVVVSVTPQDKKYTRTLLNEQQINKIQRKNDARFLIMEFMSGEYIELGPAVIDGIEVYGIERANPMQANDILENAVGRLWVDTKTDMPVRMELEGVMTGSCVRVKMVTDEFRWNIGLGASDFGPIIPDEYEEIK